MTALTDLLGTAKGDDSIDAIAARASAAGHPINRATIAKYLAGHSGRMPPEATIQSLAAGFRLPVPGCT